MGCRKYICDDLPLGIRWAFFGKFLASLFLFWQTLQNLSNYIKKTLKLWHRLCQVLLEMEGVIQNNNQQWNSCMVCQICQMDTARFLMLLQCCCLNALYKIVYIVYISYLYIILQMLQKC